MKKEIKNIFNKSYEQHQSDVDPARIWEAIELKKEKKKPRGILWWLIGSSLVVLTLFIYQYSGNGAEENTIVSEKIPSKEEGVTNLSENEVPTETKTAIKNDKIKSNKNQEHKTAVKNSQKTILGNEIILPAASNKKVVNRPSTSFATAGISVENNNRETSPIVQNIEKTIDHIVNKNNPNEIEKTESTTAIHDLQNLNGNANKGWLNSSRLELERMKFLKQDISAIENPMIIVPCFLMFSPLDKKVAMESVEEDKEKESNKIQFNLAALGTAGLFTDNYVNGDPDYLAFRDERENPLESFGSQVTVGFKLGSFGLETGVNYLRSNRIMEWSNKYFGDINGKFLYSHDPNSINPALLMQGAPQDSLQVFYYDRTLRKYNETHTISIPVTLSYIHSFKAIDLGIYGGAAFHLAQRNNNDVLSNDRVLLDQRIDTQIKRDPDWMTGFFLDYKLAERFSLSARAGLRFRKTQESDLSIQTNFYTLGLGLKYLLN